MTQQLDARTRQVANSHRGEQRDFFLLYAICFTVFLVVACLARLVGWRWLRWSDRRGSVIQEARSAASIALSSGF